MAINSLMIKKYIKQLQKFSRNNNINKSNTFTNK